MYRCTTKLVEASFDLLMTVIKGRTCYEYNDVGSYRLDRNVNGWAIERIINLAGDTETPFGARLNNKDFCMAVQFLLDSLREARKLQTGDNRTANFTLII